ncbi:ROK family protein [Chelativorans alearense]|uniref:ROK family protein n=1 Tax=Chelativorans alearense TaxID=2681495 RepID=UPI0013D28F78|nr:ROK family protein [Chelativorans alearense]
MLIAFDIGGTTIKGAVVHSLDHIEPVRRMPTPTRDFEAFVASLKSVIAAAGGRPDCIAISIAGVIDPDTHAAICANIPCIHGRRLEADLQRELGLPVIVANDADCFTMAEAAVGAGRGHNIVFGAILGTGVGGGLVARGQLVNTEGGFAGEWGHGPVAAAFAGNPPVAIPAFKCGCGQEGCIDTVGGARGMERLHRLLHDQELASEDIVAAWEKGDAQAARTVDVFVDLLSGPLAMVVNVTGATIVPVGGGLANAQALLSEIDMAVRKRILRRFDRPLVVRGACRVEPGLMGAALLGFKKVERERHPA